MRVKLPSSRRKPPIHPSYGQSPRLSYVPPRFIKENLPPADLLQGEGRLETDASLTITVKNAPSGFIQTPTWPGP